MSTNTNNSAIASPARERLASLIAARDEISASVDRAQTAIDRLASAQTIETPIFPRLLVWTRSNLML